MTLEVNSDGYVINAIPAPENVMDLLNGVLAPLPGYSTITDSMKNDALRRSLTPDAQGRWPVEPGYIQSFDIYWAAMSLVKFLQAQPVVRQTSSEGTSISVDPPNWGGIVDYCRGQSVIAQATQSGPLLRAVPIPETLVVTRTDMSGRGDNYGDVDTDLG